MRWSILGRGPNTFSSCVGRSTRSHAAAIAFAIHRYDMFGQAHPALFFAFGVADLAYLPFTKTQVLSFHRLMLVK